MGILSQVKHKQKFCLCFLLFLVLFFDNSIAQNPSFQWAKRIGGNFGENVNSCDVDVNGNVFITGSFNGIVDFDPTSSTYTLNASNGGAYFAKYDSNGGLLWVRQIGAASTGAGNSIVIDVGGNVFVAGAYTGNGDLDPGPSTYTLNFPFGGSYVSKYDQNGNFVWAKGFDGANLPLINIDALNNIYLTGRFSGTVDFDPGVGVYNLNSVGSSSNVYILKLDLNSNFLWAKRFGGSSLLQVYSIASANNGDVYISGSFNSGVTNFNPGTGTYTLNPSSGSGYILKLDLNGNFSWAKNGGGGMAIYYSIDLDQNANIYTTGHFQGTGDFNPSPGTTNLSSYGGSDIFVSKSDSSGNLIWVKQMGGTNDDWAYSLSLDGSNNIFITGGFQGISDMDPGVNTYNISSNSSGGKPDVFISKLDQNGVFNYAKGFGGISGDAGTSVSAKLSSSIFIVGTFLDMVDFNPPNSYYLTSSSTFPDLFIVKYSSGVGVEEYNSFNGIVIYPNPSNSNIYINNSSGYDEVQIENMFGQLVFISKNDNPYDLSNLCSGIYCVKLLSYTKGLIGSKKIIKN